MPDILFIIAAMLALLWFNVHLFVGGKKIATPLLATQDIPPVARDTQYLCWHFTSVSIAAIAMFFGMASWLGDNAYAVAGTILASGISVVGIGLVVAIGQSHARTPQGWLFVPIAALGITGLIVG